MHRILPMLVAAAAGSDDTFYYEHPADAPAFQIDSISLMPDLAVTANDTDYVTFDLYNTTANKALDSRTTQVTGGAALVAGTKIAVTVPGTIDKAALLIAPGTILRARGTHTASGKAFKARYQIKAHEVAT